jgi:uncharacterized protein (TIGR02147 family)
VTGNLNLFEYSDYRAFLRDYYGEQKKKNPSYSYRLFANKAKLGSPNYLKLVIDGKRRVTDQNLPHFARGLHLGREEAEYFRNLVLFQESKDHEAKNNSLAEVLKLRARHRKDALEIEESRLEFLKNWYHAAVRELVMLKDFKPSPDWISARLGGKITPAQAEESIEVLKRLEFIREDEKGHYTVSDPLITTSDEISSHLIRQVHRQFMELGTQAIFDEPVGRREVNNLTVALPRSKIPEVKNAIKEFRKDLNKRFSTQQGNDEVYQLVINFYPLTKEESDDE